MKTYELLDWIPNIIIIRGTALPEALICSSKTSTSLEMLLQEDYKKIQ